VAVDEDVDPVALEQAIAEQGHRESKQLYRALVGRENSDPSCCHRTVLVVPRPPTPMSLSCDRDCRSHAAVDVTLLRSVPESPESIGICRTEPDLPDDRSEVVDTSALVKLFPRRGRKPDRVEGVGGRRWLGDIRGDLSRGASRSVDRSHLQQDRSPIDPPSAATTPCTWRRRSWWTMGERS